jgi:DNA processing protein
MGDESAVAAWLKLTHVRGVRRTTLQELVAAFGSPRRLLAAGRTRIASVAGTEIAQAIIAANALDVDRALAWAKQPRCAILTPDDPTYPSPLAAIADPPLVLHAIGKLGLLANPGIAIVGSRSASAQGLDNARQFSRALSDAGLTVISGLAQGIDTAAHEGALEGHGSTIAVLGTGIDVIYPRANEAITERIMANGLLLSEWPLGTPALPANFPQRNRIISGLAQGCLVVEASLSSGSLITARLAAEQGREVFAIPGSIHSPTSKGCHALIKDGAKLVECVDDVLTELHLASRSDGRRAGAPIAPAQAAEQPLERALGYDPVDLDMLCARLSLTPDVVSAMLLELELEGRVVALPGGRYQRRSSA